MHRLDESLRFVKRGPGLPFRRHFTGMKLIENAHPRLSRLEDRCLVLEDVKRYFPLLLLLAVAIDTVFFDERDNNLRDIGNILGAPNRLQ